MLSVFVRIWQHDETMSRTERLFQLMQALRRLPPPATAATLAQETGVSERTLYRDIDALRGLGAVIDGAAGYGYTLIEDPHLPPLSFGDEELEALVLGLREVAAVGDPALAEAAESALLKLRARLPDRQAQQLRHAVLTAHRFAPPAAPGIDARSLRRACREERVIRFGYRDAEGAATERDVKPLSLIYFDSSHCLIAWCLLRGDYRTFRLDRMTALQVTGTSFRPERVPLLRDFMETLPPRMAGNCGGRA